MHPSYVRRREPTTVIAYSLSSIHRWHQRYYELGVPYSNEDIIIVIAEVEECADGSRGEGDTFIWKMAGNSDLLFVTVPT